MAFAKVDILKCRQMLAVKRIFHSLRKSTHTVDLFFDQLVSLDISQNTGCPAGAKYLFKMCPQ